MRHSGCASVSRCRKLQGAVITKKNKRGATETKAHTLKIIRRLTCQAISCWGMSEIGMHSRKKRNSYETVNILPESRAENPFYAEEIPHPAIHQSRACARRRSALLFFINPLPTRDAQNWTNHFNIRASFLITLAATPLSSFVTIKIKIFQQDYQTTVANIWYSSRKSSGLFHRIFLQVQKNFQSNIYFFKRNFIIKTQILNIKFFR